MDTAMFVAQVVAIIAAVAAFLGLSLDIQMIEQFLTAKVGALAAAYVAVQAFLPSLQGLWGKVTGSGE